MSTFKIRGFTGPNPDFSFTVVSPVMPVGNELRNCVLGHFEHNCLWTENLETTDIDFDYELSLDSERPDLRDNESQRVWVYDSIYCNQDQDIYDTEHDCNDGQCDRDMYMITIDIERN